MHPRPRASLTPGVGPGVCSSATQGFQGAAEMDGTTIQPRKARRHVLHMLTAWLYRFPAAQPPGHRTPQRLGLTASLDRRVDETPREILFRWVMSVGIYLRSQN